MAIKFIGEPLGVTGVLAMSSGFGVSVEVGVPLIFLGLMAVAKAMVIADGYSDRPHMTVREDVIRVTEPIQVDTAIMGLLDQGSAGADKAPSAAKDLLRAQHIAEEARS